MSPVFPDTFGKLMSLLEMSDGKKAIYGGVQGGGGTAGIAAGGIQGASGPGSGIHNNMLRKWIRLAQGDSNPKLTKATESATELARENQRLQKELARVKMERDILKKATAYFAKKST